MKQFKIRVNPEQSEIVQKEMFKRGYRWLSGKKEVSYTEAPYLYIMDDVMIKTYLVWESDDSEFEECQLPELTFSEWRDIFLPKKKLPEYFKIKVNPKQSEIVQKIMFAKGFEWIVGGKNVYSADYHHHLYFKYDFHVGRKLITQNNKEYVFENNNLPEVTFNELLMSCSKRTKVTKEVISDLKERKKLGKEKYGEVLKTNNGRDALQDAYEEALYLVQYLKQAILERDE